MRQRINKVRKSLRRHYAWCVAFASMLVFVSPSAAYAVKERQLNDSTADSRAAIGVSCDWVRPIKPQAEKLFSNALGLAFFGIGIFILALIVIAIYRVNTNKRGKSLGDLGLASGLAIAFPVLLVFVNTAIQKC